MHILVSISFYLCDTDGSCSHANPQSIDSSINEVLGLLCSHYVAPYDLQVRMVLFDVLDHANLKDRVVLGGVLGERKREGLNLSM